MAILKKRFFKMFGNQLTVQLGFKLDEDDIGTAEDLILILTRMIERAKKDMAETEERAKKIRIKGKPRKTVLKVPVEAEENVEE